MFTDLFTTDGQTGLQAEPFPCFSARSVPPHELDLATRLAEIERERHHRLSSYPSFIERDTMTADEAEAGIIAFEAIAQDLAGLSAPGSYAPHPLPWRTKLDALRHEIIKRRRSYVRQIDRELLTVADARARMSAIEAVHWSYWAQLFAWCTPADVDDARHKALVAHGDAIDQLGGLAAALNQRLAFPLQAGSAAA